MPARKVNILITKSKKNKIAIGARLDFHPPPSTTVSCREGEEMVAQHKQGKSDRSHLTKGIIQFSQQSSYYNLFRRRPKKSQLCYPGQNLPKTHKRRYIITLPKQLFPPFLRFYLQFALVLKHNNSQCLYLYYITQLRLSDKLWFYKVGDSRELLKSI